MSSIENKAEILRDYEEWRERVSLELDTSPAGYVEHLRNVESRRIVDKIHADALSLNEALVAAEEPPANEREVLRQFVYDVAVLTDI